MFIEILLMLPVFSDIWLIDPYSLNLTIYCNDLFVALFKFTWFIIWFITWNSFGLEIIKLFILVSKSLLWSSNTQNVGRKYLIFNWAANFSAHKVILNCSYNLVLSVNWDWCCDLWLVVRVLQAWKWNLERG